MLREGMAMKRPIRIVLAIVINLIITILWIVLGEILFNWKNMGGAIPMVIYLSIIIFVWRKITKRTSEENGNISISKHSDDVLLKYENMLKEGTITQEEYDNIKSGFYG